MTLKEKINQDFKDAFKAKEELKVSVLRLLNSSLKNKETEKRTKLVKTGQQDEAVLVKDSQLLDEEVLAVIGAEAKRRKDSIEQYKTGGRPELAAQEEAELAILTVYLPEQMGEEEIRKIVQESITESGAVGVVDLGKIMKVLMPRVKGKADGGMVNKIVKEELEK
ncbi:GatB/YqeY domain-containing protein [Patescibacteria group bacterium]|nr:GatB/YqeY domain-containing protein [Patescibacteria group bacterium]MBU2264585.1 GatB/YqeY domain-containing protein [Patescibacteria group bacterium]